MKRRLRALVVFGAVTLAVSLLTVTSAAVEASFRINAGGPDLLVGPWSVDNNTQPSKYSNHEESGSRAILPTDDPQAVTASVPSGTNTNMFRSHRFDPMGGPDMQWDFPVPDGGYEVRLYFSEIADEPTGSTQIDGPGERVFDVVLEATRVLNDLDVFAQAGGPDIGIARSFLIESSGGIDIDLQHEVQNPMISGIEIIPVGSDYDLIDALPSALNMVTKPSTTTSAAVTVTNDGDSSAPRARIRSVSLSGPDAARFSHDFSGNVFLSGGQSAGIEVDFNAPGSEGVFDAQLIVDVEGLDPFSISLTGVSSATAQPSSLSTTSTALDFGSISVADTTTKKSLQVTNSGTIFDITIAGVETVGANAGEFRASAAESTLSPGATTTITVVFDPASLGTKSATLRIDHDGTNAPTEIGLSGTAAEAPIPNAGFNDVGDSIFQTEINWLAAEGITKGCNPPENSLFCPKDFVTRGQMAAFLHRALDGVLEPGAVTDFVDDNDSVFEADIEWLGATGVTKGCNPPANDRFCPGDFVTRGQMAAFLHRALDGMLEFTSFPTYIDDDASVFEADIEWLGATGVTKGCNPPANDRFCPDDHVTREQMAAFLYRALSER